MIMSKRGVSPIIATVILIAFAVSFGAVIMNWGKSVAHEEEAETLKWYMGSNIEDLCYDDTSIVFSLKGDPETNIQATGIVAKGSILDYVPTSIAEIPGPGEVNRITIPFDVSKYGAPNQIIFYSIDTAITRDLPKKC